MLAKDSLASAHLCRAELEANPPNEAKQPNPIRARRALVQHALAQVTASCFRARPEVGVELAPPRFVTTACATDPLARHEKRKTIFRLTSSERSIERFRPRAFDWR